MIKISDYVIDYIYKLGVDKIFCVTGGGAMHLNYSLGCNKNVDGVFMLHEQGAAIAAEAYARVKDGYGCCLVTSGPGATNALTGLVGAYIDSIPVIFISGQAKSEDLIGKQGVRQFGIQEVDIISMVKSYTKYATEIKKPEDIRYELEKASAIATNGRPGPVWISIPLDIQASIVDIEEMEGYDDDLNDFRVDEELVSNVINLINNSKRPVLYLGHGIRLGHAINEMRQLYNLLGVPVLTSWNGVDLIESDNINYFGRPGAVGHRSANIILQSADLVITIGTRLNLLSTGFNYDGFLSRAIHVMVDIDINEMNKKNVKPDLKIVCDAKYFICSLLNRINEISLSESVYEWINHCSKLKAKYPEMIKEQEISEKYVNTYHLVKEISRQMEIDDIYQFTSSGTSVDIGMKVFDIKWGQRAFLTKGLASMGYDVPASIGSCIASGNKRTVCVTGDGSVVMNIQELEVIKRLDLPVKIFVTNNHGYSMIFQSQMANFKENPVGCTENNGLSLPNINKVAESFGIKTFIINNENNLKEIIKESLDYDGPTLTVVNSDIRQKVLPKQTNYMRKDGQMDSRPLEEMSPLIDEKELREDLLL